MARFKFSLQKLLNVKKFKEDQKAVELAVAQARLNQELQNQKMIGDLKGSYFYKSSGKGATLAELRAGNDYLLQLNRQLVQAKQKITKAENKVDDKRKLLTLANQEKKSIELLKEKKYLQYKKAENQEAMKKENEVALRMLSEKNQEML